MVPSELQRPSVEASKNILLSMLTCKVAFLVVIASARQVTELAALSCKEPLLLLHRHKVVLRPGTFFLPTVISSFYLNQDIVLPSLCPAAKHPK